MGERWKNWFILSRRKDTQKGQLIIVALFTIFLRKTLEYCNHSTRVGLFEPNNVFNTLSSWIDPRAIEFTMNKKPTSLDVGS